MTPEIEKNIPLPNGRVRSVQRYPWQNMEVGDSFFTEEQDRNRIASALSYAGSRNGRKFTIRKMDGGFRVWRTE